jgi:hypothetical protein
VTALICNEAFEIPNCTKRGKMSGIEFMQGETLGVVLNGWVEKEIEMCGMKIPG